ncbi:MAG: hypothetical protein KKD18_06150 [Nanoarchaeota archaeon]|nr:hypothetical protein [Nanoarchaeota archaeon]MBU0977974.1 hypothetical protein [Nanoarchaeota archaeon]
MKKRGIEQEMLGWILIGLAVLVILVVAVVILQGKGSSYIEYIKQLFRFK